ncbi:alpha-ketoacid dehydrogenase kinase N-terminal domain-containing protein [Punctularia strigosozonata HHB-11173 SS5]|uniref:alpha-ketoacid dehydrogenase kinase N-terminal domain-containing protein n=1 Tax=Punctularia strigosozonata (strain HHB-11173) TaxID=741275 RepID=UPI0004417E81|nr:alpha-ketoacid dehydrogenase kinase N-terminal domain-containing protein [Punctularia strigosozonata HHB-11173 SS5]EIN08681.1 alpha-ketoacid dehydrogenase kinase N-terminal domain-containing protein [Punctularia strigosozonata HHB-11173 SS5]
MSAGFRITPALWDRIHHFASFPQTGGESLSLQQMVLFGQNPSQGTLLAASQFLGEELPIRLAHRVKELDTLPHNLSKMPSIEKVKNWYAHSFEELIRFPPPRLPSDLRKELAKAEKAAREEGDAMPESIPNPSLIGLGDGYTGIGAGPIGDSFVGYSSPAAQGTGIGNKFKLRVPMERRYYANPRLIDWPPEVHDYNARFTKMLERIKSRHDPTVTTVAQGVLEWKRSTNARHIGLDIQAWLDRFYMSRIGIRFLIGQHIALNKHEKHPGWVGIICTESNVHDIIQESIENARFVCEEHYAMFRGPPVELICPPDLQFAYVPGHLSHIVFELLKNSLRAVVERYGPDYQDNGGSQKREYPKIRVIVVEGKEDITIKISDEGGGIPRSAIPLIWTYMYTTMEGQAIDQDFQASDFKAPMAGFGYGLPLSRLYARYFGGDLRLISMEGYGTDVYIHLNRLSSSREPLP